MEDKARKQKRLFEVFSKHMGFEFHQFPKDNKEYRIDGCCHLSKNVTCWIKTQWYEGDADFTISVPKFGEMFQLSRITGLESYFLFREHKRWGYILIHDGKRFACDHRTQLAPHGDTMKPMIVLSKQNIIWGK